MNRRILIIVAVVVSLSWLAGAAIRETPSLPGALPEVAAADYPSIQAALNVVAETGGLVRLPAGTFEISSPLVIARDDVCLLGAGTATHIKNTNTNGMPAIVIAHREHQRSGNDRRHELWRVRLANFRVTGNSKSGDGIIAHNVNELFVDGVSLSYHGADGLELSYCYEDPRIVDSLFTYNKQTGVNLVGCHDIVVSANQFEENQDGLHCYDGFNLCLTGNCLDDHLGRGVVIENTYGSVVSGNMIEECKAAALVMDRDCYGNTVCANVIAHNGFGIDLRDAHGCSISANTFTIMKNDAVRIGPNSGRITLSGNSFSDSYIGEGTNKRSDDDREAAGLSLSGRGAVLVSGNVFAGLSSPGVAMENQSQARAAITNNYFVETNPGVETGTITGDASVNNFSISSDK